MEIQIYSKTLCQSFVADTFKDSEKDKADYPIVSKHKKPHKVILDHRNKKQRKNQNYSSKYV